MLLLPPNVARIRPVVGEAAPGVGVSCGLESVRARPVGWGMGMRVGRVRGGLAAVMLLAAAGLPLRFSAAVATGQVRRGGFLRLGCVA